MTTPGISLLNLLTTSNMASVPPVEAPIATIRSVPPLICVVIEPASTRFNLPTFAVDAILTFVANSCVKKLFNCSLVKLSGLLTKSTAPASSASNTLSLNALIITTGNGYCGISFLKNSIPLILGNSTSNVITSGLYFTIASLAS